MQILLSICMIRLRCSHSFANISHDDERRHARFNMIFSRDPCSADRHGSGNVGTVQYLLVFDRRSLSDGSLFSQCVVYIFTILCI